MTEPFLDQVLMAYGEKIIYFDRYQSYLLSVAYKRRKLLKTTYAEERIASIQI